MLNHIIIFLLLSQTKLHQSLGDDYRKDAKLLGIVLSYQSKKDFESGIKSYQGVMRLEASNEKFWYAAIRRRTLTANEYYVIEVYCSKGGAVKLIDCQMKGDNFRNLRWRTDKNRNLITPEGKGNLEYSTNRTVEKVKWERFGSYLGEKKI